MATTHHISADFRLLKRAVLATAVVAVAAAAGVAQARDEASPTAGTPRVSTSAVTVASTSAPAGGLYGWPIKPFNRQHPVRGFFNDPRIGAGGGHSFHFGIDIATPDGTPVYAVSAGTAYVSTKRTVSVIAPGRAVIFGYWHIVPAVTHGQLVRKHQLLGYVDTGAGHVHFAERRGGQYVNPLRPHALAPYVDHTPPTVRRIDLLEQPNGLEVQADAFDTTSPRVTGPWADLPVTPVLLQWRVLGASGMKRAWRTGVDFRPRSLEQSRFFQIYDARTRQNHKHKAGVYRFRIARGWRPSDGSYVLQVRASDTRGNSATLSTTLTIAGGTVLI